LHVGDARATQLGKAGELNIGQLVRARHGDETLLAASTTYSGTVTAASDWGGPAERKRIRRALRGSWEDLFHLLGEPRFLLDPSGLDERRLERAIGVIYKPETERVSHYFEARLADQFERRDPHRRDPRSRAARAPERVGGRRAAGDLPLGRLGLGGAGRAKS